MRHERFDEAWWLREAVEMLRKVARVGERYGVAVGELHRVKLLLRYSHVPIPAAHRGFRRYPWLPPADQTSSFNGDIDECLLRSIEQMTGADFDELQRKAEESGIADGLREILSMSEPRVRHNSADLKLGLPPLDVGGAQAAALRLMQPSALVASLR